MRQMYRLPTKKRHTRMTGVAFLTEIEDINRFPSMDRFAAHAGLVPAIRRRDHFPGAGNNCAGWSPEAHG
ncbi:hypothetical protein FACS1894181_01540 [Bacteroidia bacterium]|nr:hypothetical protein FACS1894181_01540 [Bacteroidia bacterium]